MQQEGADVGILVRASGRGSSIIVWREHWVKSQQALPGIESAMKQHDLRRVKLSLLRIVIKRKWDKTSGPLEIWKIGANINSFFIHSASVYIPETSDSYQHTRRHWGDPWAESHEFLMQRRDESMSKSLQCTEGELKFQQLQSTLRAEMTMSREIIKTITASSLMQCFEKGSWPDWNILKGIEL